MKVLSISGGETKASGLAGIAKSVIKEKGFKPDIITATSASSLLSVLIALEMWETVKIATTTLELEQIFSSKPINKKRKLTFKAIFRILKGKESISVMDNLDITIKKYIKKETFENYVLGDYPTVFVNTTDFKTGKKCIYNLKEVSYEKFINIVKGSSSIPLLGETVKFDEGYHLDGGVRATILSTWIINKFKNKIKTHISIYSRPENVEDILEKWEIGNSVNTAKRALDIGLLTISKKDEFIEDLQCKEYKINQHKLYLTKLTDKAFNVDKNYLLKLYNEGIKIGRRLKL